MSKQSIVRSKYSRLKNISLLTLGNYAGKLKSKIQLGQIYTHNNL